MQSASSITTYNSSKSRQQFDLSKSSSSNSISLIIKSTNLEAVTQTNPRDKNYYTGGKSSLNQINSKKSECYLSNLQCSFEVQPTNRDKHDEALAEHTAKLNTLTASFSQSIKTYHTHGSTYSSATAVVHSLPSEGPVLSEGMMPISPRHYSNNIMTASCYSGEGRVGSGRLSDAKCCCCCVIS